MRGVVRLPGDQQLHRSTLDYGAPALPRRRSSRTPAVVPVEEFGVQIGDLFAWTDRCGLHAVRVKVDP
ncbi:MAG: hypothetical protein ACRDO1_09205 [Nocardioidaceae bacterium]